MLKRIDMKREILFRGYSEALNKWVEGGVYTYEGEVTIIHRQGNNLMHNTAVHPDSVGQFTGLCDMEGIKIFEGDVLKVGENLTCEVVYIGTNSDDYGDEINASFHAKIHQHDKVIPLDGYLKKYCKIIGNTFKP
jgi:uncharacterized phage protein (TIGR01671 family)